MDYPYLEVCHCEIPRPVRKFSIMARGVDWAWTDFFLISFDEASYSFIDNKGDENEKRKMRDCII